MCLVLILRCNSPVADVSYEYLGFLLSTINNSMMFESPALPLHFEATPRTGHLTFDRKTSGQCRRGYQVYPQSRFSW